MERRRQASYEAAMEPGRCGRVEHLGHSDHRRRGQHAAMEPGRCGRVEPEHGVSKRCIDVAAMEPGRCGRVESPASSRLARSAGDGRNGARPLRPGRVLAQGARRASRVPAAMEPGRCGRVEQVRCPLNPNRQIAAMEPGRCGRVECVGAWLQHCRAPAAMEPGRCGRVERKLRAYPLRTLSTPQWSPAVAAGSSSDDRSEIRDHRHAAMEPGRCGRVEPGNVIGALKSGVGPQWSPAVAAGSSVVTPNSRTSTTARRNGARPLRPGRGRRRSTWCA